MVYEIKTYALRNNKKPFDQWLWSLKDEIARSYLMNRLARIEGGNFGDYKSLGDGVYEFRVHYGTGYRIYFGLHNKNIILLLGGEKSRQEKDIKRSKQYWLDFRERFYA